ncbi:MAG: YggS family pyridoxal phosphate-dependent enzyme [Dehalococcoidales bacterium]|nr:YggS family pyridoxal phosphate-dependent enzyme [Dehalococcoidales bacterium]
MLKYLTRLKMIEQNVSQILSELPAGVELVAAAKTRQPAEILEAAEAGVKIIGENYVQEAERAYETAGNRVKWHFIGHLQKNKIKKAVRIFDMIETVDSSELAREIDKRCSQIGKVMPILIEINSGREEQKAGILPEEAEQLIREISAYQNIKVMGLMTMGPFAGDPEDSRPYFVETRKIFERIEQLQLPNVDMRYLSMGMTNSYKIAIEEGANIVRIGSKIFGERDYGTT